MDPETDMAPPLLRRDGAQSRAEAFAQTAGKRTVDGVDLAFAPGSYDASRGEVDVVWSTGADVNRRDWWTGERYVERLDLAGADLARFNAGGPLLADHWNSVGALVGSIVPGSARVEAGRGLARVRFDRASAEGQAVESKVAGGHLRSVSIGYQVEEWEKTRAAENADLVVWTAKRWVPMEISFVAVPADAGAGTRSAPGGGAAEPAPSLSINRGQPPHNPEPVMAEETKPGAAAPNTEAAERAAPQAAAAPTEQLATVAELRGLADKLGLGAEWALDQVAAGATMAAARMAAIDAVAARSAPPLQPSMQVLQDAGDTRRAAMEGFIAYRLNPGANPLQGPAVEYRGASLLDLARACLQATGGQVRGLTPSEIARAAMNLPGARELVRGMGTSSDFPQLLANAQSKQLLAAYGVQPRTFTQWAGRRDLPDFKQAQIAEMGAAPDLLPLAEGGNIETGIMGQGGQTWQLVRYARNVPLSYVAIVNDDLGAFQRLAAGFATSVSNLENRTVYGLLNTPPTMADGQALFYNARTVNLNGTDITLSNLGSGALSVDNYAALRTLLSRMRDSTGQEMNLIASVVLVPSELEAAALALFSSMVVPTAPATSGVNPYRGTVTPIATPFLSDANDWFATVGAGTGYEAVEYGYEAGSTGPELTSYTDPSVDGVVFSCRHSFGAAAATWRTIAKSAN